MSCVELSTFRASHLVVPHAGCAHCWCRVVTVTAALQLPEITELEPLEAKLPRIEPDAMSFLQSTLRYEPASRASCVDLLSSPFFEGFEEWFMPVRQAIRAHMHAPPPPWGTALAEYPAASWLCFCGVDVGVLFLCVMGCPWPLVVRRRVVGQQLTEAIEKDNASMVIKKKKKRSDRDRRTSMSKSVPAGADDGKDRGNKSTLLPLELTTMSVTSVGTDGDPLSTRRTKVGSA